MAGSHKREKKSKEQWTVFRLTFGLVVGAIVGIIAYNQNWLG